MPAVSDVFASPPPTDLSYQLINQVVGQGWDKLSQAVGGGDGSSPALTQFLLEAFRAMNTVALAIAAILITWTLLIGAVGTAHEGEPLGRRFSTLWTPIRSAVSVGMLAPTIKGLSLIQVVILLCLGYSLSFANYIWSVGLNYLGDHKGAIMATAAPGAEDNGWQMAEAILKAEVAQGYLLTYQGFDAGHWSGGYVTSRTIPPADGTPGRIEIAFQAPTTGPEGSTLMRPEDFGTITIPCLDDDAKICQQRATAINGLIMDLRPAAAAIIAKQPGARDAAITAVQRYAQTVSATTADAQPAYEQDLQRFLDQAKIDGWLAAGGYYWTMVRFSERAVDSVGALPTAGPGRYDRMAATGYRDWAGYEAGVTNTIQDGQADRRAASASAARGGSSPDSGQPIKDFVYACLGGWTLPAMLNHLGQGDPVLRLSELGHSIVSGTEVALVALSGARAVTKAAADKLNSGLTGDVINVTPGANAAAFAAAVGINLLDGAWNLILLAAVQLFLGGLFLAYYLPALPFILWFAALVGWLVLVIETLAAAPLWAVAHALPEGEGLAGVHGRQGYMLLLGILARPPLMLVGLIAAIASMGALGKVLVALFSIFIGGTAGVGHVFGLTATIAYLLIITMTLVVSAHKLFGLISHLPEKVTAWIGGGGVQLGESAAEDRTRGAMTGASRSAAGTAEKTGASPLATVGPRAPTGGATDTNLAPGDVS